MWPGSRRSLMALVVGWVLGLAVIFESRVVGAAGAPGTSKANSAGGAASNPESVKSCVERHLAAQELRQDGRLIESRVQLRQCSQDDCPELVRGECLRLLDELRTQIPTVIFRVTVDGETRSDVSAYIDDRQLFSEIPTRAMEFDPGKYRFRFQYGKRPPLVREITIAEGERFLPIAVSFEDPERLVPNKTQPARPPPEVPTAAQRRPVPWPVYALAGLGVVGMGGFTGFGLAARSKEKDLQSSCSPECTSSQIDSAYRLALFADISLGVGAAAIVGATTYYLLRPSESVRVGAAILPSGRLQTQLAVEF